MTDDRDLHHKVLAWTMSTQRSLALLKAELKLRVKLSACLTAKLQRGTTSHRSQWPSLKRLQMLEGLWRDGNPPTLLAGMYVGPEQYGGSFKN